MSNKSASILVTGPPSEDSLMEAAKTCREQLQGPVSAGFFFFSPEYAEHLEDYLEVLRVYGHIPILMAACGAGALGRHIEEEGGPVFSLMLLSTPETEYFTFEIGQEHLTEDTTPAELREAAGLPVRQADGLIIFGTPSLVASQTFFPTWNAAFPNLQTAGALSSGGTTPEECVMAINGEIYDSGVIGLGFRGGMKMITVTSQGCRPIGAPLTITKADNNLIYQMGGTTAYEVLDEVFQKLTEKEKANARGNLFAGLASSEYLEDFKRGDFLIRNIIGADPNSGAVVIGSPARVGQTMQYQMRDSRTAHQDLIEVYQEISELVTHPFGALLFTCIGRGRTFFKKPHHDVEALARYLHNPPVCGFFSNGEIGPVGNHVYLHSYSAVSVLFV